MMRHTPGPWTAGASMISTWTRQRQDRGERIQEIALVRENRGLGPTTREEYEANVLLIAAAPDLLGTLRRLEEYCTTQCACGSDDALLWAQAASFAAKAIAQATPTKQKEAA